MIKGLLSRFGFGKRDLTPEQIGELFNKFHAMNVGMSSVGAVTPPVALQMTAVFASVRLLSESIAMLPLNLYKRDGRNKDIATNHPLYGLIKYKPNQDMNSFVFMQTLVASMLLRGSGYIQRVVNKYGNTLELCVLLPQYVSKKRVNGSIIYTYSDGYTNRDFRQDEITNIPYFTTNGVDGLSPIGVCRNAVKLGLTAENHATFFYENGAKPSGFIKTPGVLSDDAYNRLRKSVNDNYVGSNSFKVGILEGGSEYQGVTLNLKDAQFIESRKFQVSEIARIYGVPPHKIGDLEKATFSNIEQQNTDFAVSSIQPLCTKIESALNASLLTSKEIEQGYYFKFNLAALLRGDIASRGTYYGQGRQWGWLSANDIRDLEDENPIEGGDIYLQPVNMMDASNPTNQGGTDGQKTA